MKYPKRSQYKHAKQKKYHVRNWAEYNEGLRRRGDLTVWFDEEAIANWKADKTVTSVFTDKKVFFAFAGETEEELLALKEMIEAGKIKSTVDRVFPMERVAEARTSQRMDSSTT